MIYTLWFQIFDTIIEQLNIPYNPEDKYFTSVSFMKNALKDNNEEFINKVSIFMEKDEIRLSIEMFISMLEIPYLKQSIYRLLHPEIETLLDVSEIEINKCSIHLLNNLQLFEYLIGVFYTITYNQNGNLLLLKYNVAIWNTGFHKMAKLSRGKILEMDTKNIVSYPFDKFFNLNEVPETQIDIIKFYLSRATYVYANEKLDGSTIIVTKYKNKPLITTNGAFANDQIELAKELFQKQYPKFLKEMKDNQTYLFELIHPDNRIVLDYKEEKALYLLNIRDLTKKPEILLSLEEVHKTASYFGFPVPKVYDFKDIDTMVDLAHTLKNSNQEGWVIRIGTINGEYMVKLKLDEYFQMHRMFGKIKLGWVYKHLLAGDLDDYIAMCDEYQKNQINEKLEIINKIQEKILNKIHSEANYYLNKYHIKLSEFNDDRDRMINIIQEIYKSDSNVKSYVVQYLRNPIRLNIRNMFYKTMRIFFEEFGEDVNN